MTKRHRRANLGVTNKEKQMSNGTYEGIPTTAPPGSSLPSNVIFVPENVPHYYNEEGVLQVVSVGPAEDGTVPPPPPEQYQAPGFHIQQPINTTQPQAVFGSDGICTSAGWTPGGVWYCENDRSEHPCSQGGPINAAKKEAVNNIIVWSMTLAGLEKLQNQPQPK